MITIRKDESGKYTIIGKGDTTLYKINIVSKGENYIVDKEHGKLLTTVIDKWNIGDTPEVLIVTVNDYHYGSNEIVFSSVEDRDNFVKLYTSEYVIPLEVCLTMIGEELLEGVDVWW